MCTIVSYVRQKVGSGRLAFGGEDKGERIGDGGRGSTSCSSETKSNSLASWSPDASSPGGSEGASSAGDMTSEAIGGKLLGIATLSGGSALAVIPDSKDCITRNGGTCKQPSDAFGGAGESKKTPEPNGLNGPEETSEPCDCD